MKLAGMQRQTEFKLLDAAYRFHLALIGNSSLTEKSFEDNQQVAQERFWDMAGVMQPWEGANYADRKQKEFTGHRQAYIDAFGVDPADPGFKQWEAEQIAKLRAKEPDYRESDEEAVTRRLRERAASRT